MSRAKARALACLHPPAVEEDMKGGKEIERGKEIEERKDEVRRDYVFFPPKQ